ncbi:hypothetical protein ASC95_17835 [Pelomonas sp. Root1217]|nr:hypothetical protein ASC95_17835 [Pelomonas sp. Root1217]
MLERADDLFGEVANALWLVVATSWRVPIALCRATGLERIKELVNSRLILPPRVGMLVAALASALMMVMLVAGGMNSATSMAGKLASASPEAWLAVAAPALLSLWLTMSAGGLLLRLLIGADWQRAQTGLTQAVVSVALACNVGMLGLGIGESWLKTLREGLPDTLLLTAAALAALFLAYVGWNCSRQVTAGLPRWRRAMAQMLFPALFLGAAVISLIGTYWFVKGREALDKAMNEPPPPGYVHASSSQCVFTAEHLLCTALLSSTTDLSLTAASELKLAWNDPSRSGSFTPFGAPTESLLKSLTAPVVDLGKFWTLRAKEPQPLSILLDRKTICGLRDAVLASRQRLDPIDISRANIVIEIEVHWLAGYGLVVRDDAGLTLPDVRLEYGSSYFERELEKFCVKA